jgi:hypothetical protein
MQMQRYERATAGNELVYVIYDYSLTTEARLAAVCELPLYAHR